MNVSHQPLVVTRFSNYFLFFCFWLVLFLFSLILRPFFAIIIFAAVCVVALSPIHRRVVGVFRNPSLSAAISCILFITALIIPTVILFLMLKDEVSSLYISVQSSLQPGVLNSFFQWTSGHFVYDLYQQLIVGIPMQSLDVSSQIVGFIHGASDFLFRQSQAIINGSFHFLIDFLIAFFILFYFFRDGKAIVAKITHLSPLPQKQEDLLITKVHSLMSVIFYGILLSAIMQGLIGGIGFMLAGVGRPVLWGVLIAFFSPIPYIGTALIWVPAVVLLYLSGDYGHAIFLALWSATIMSSVDAFLKPIFIGKQVNIHPLLMFFSLFGGMILYGPSGLVIGPLVPLLVITFSEMYSENKGTI